MLAATARLKSSALVGNESDCEEYPSAESVKVALANSPHRPLTDNSRYFQYTEHHLMLEFKLTPCATLLYHWILLKAPAGIDIEFDLHDFRAFSSEHRTKPYSIKQIRRACAELEANELLTITRERVRGQARHPGPIVPLNATRTKMSGGGTKMSRSKTKTSRFRTKTSDLKAETQENQAVPESSDLFKEIQNSSDQVALAEATPTPHPEEEIKSNNQEQENILTHPPQPGGVDIAAINTHVEGESKSERLDQPETESHTHSLVNEQEISRESLQQSSVSGKDKTSAAMLQQINDIPEAIERLLQTDSRAKWLWEKGDKLPNPIPEKNKPRWVKSQLAPEKWQKWSADYEAYQAARHPFMSHRDVPDEIQEKVEQLKEKGIQVGVNYRGRSIKIRTEFGEQTPEEFMQMPIEHFGTRQRISSEQVKELMQWFKDKK